MTNLKMKIENLLTMEVLTENKLDGVVGGVFTKLGSSATPSGYIKKEKLQALTKEDLEEVSGGWSWSGYW